MLVLICIFLFLKRLKFFTRTLYWKLFEQSLQYCICIMRKTEAWKCRLKHWVQLCSVWQFLLYEIHHSFFFLFFFFFGSRLKCFFFLTLKNFVWKAFETNSAMWNSGSRNWPSVKWVFEWWDAFIIPGQANNIIKIPYMSFERKVLKTNPTASNSRWKQDASTKTLFGTCKEYSDNSSDNKERVPVLVMRAIE